MHLYLHIPFCKQACHYCDFHFSTNTSNKAKVVESIAKEITLRKDYIPTKTLETIYFGGGTPSMLDARELDLVFETIYKNFSVEENAEITLEANPDDLSAAKIRDFKSAGINRLSIGIQSFYDPHLKFLNRVHSGSDAEYAVRSAQDAGIDNISIDLIYAIHSQDHGVLLNDIEKTFGLNIPHISAYCLTIEPRTTFGNWLKNSRLKPIDEEFAASQFDILIREHAGKGYEQYDISNFARENKYSRHNSSYWKQRPYLGVGPGAHSYNGVSREFNIPNNAKYVEAIQTGTIPAEVETLSVADQTNEYLLTGLRTKWGVSKAFLENVSQGQFYREQQEQLGRMKEMGWIREEGDYLFLTHSGKLFADRIASDLFID